MSRAVSFALLWSTLLCAAAWAQELPKFNIDATCGVDRSAMKSESQAPVSGCKQSELDAQRQLESRWSTFAAQSRRTCSQETQIGGSPSYVELLTCLEMAEGKLTPRTTTPEQQPAQRGSRQR